MKIKVSLLLLVMLLSNAAFAFTFSSSFLPSTKDVQHIKAKFHKIHIKDLFKDVLVDDAIFIRYKKDLAKELNGNLIRRTRAREMHVSFREPSTERTTRWNENETVYKNYKDLKVNNIDKLERAIDQATVIAIELSHGAICYAGSAFDSNFSFIVNAFKGRTFYCGADSYGHWLSKEPFEILPDFNEIKYLKKRHGENKKIAELLKKNPSIYKNTADDSYVFYYGIEQPVVMLLRESIDNFSLGSIQFSIDGEGNIIDQKTTAFSECISHIVRMPNRQQKLEYDEDKFVLTDVKTGIKDSYFRIDPINFDERYLYRSECTN